jgi:hypothetical protein
MIKIGQLGLRIGDFMKILIAAQNVVIGSVTSKVNTAITCNLTKVVNSRILESADFQQFFR